MVAKPLVAVLLLTAFALAGCADDGGDGEATSSSSASLSAGATSPGSSSARTTTSSASATGTPSSGPAPNRPPTGTLAILPDGLDATFNMTGSDPDGDALSWTLAFGDGASDDGDALPASVEHTFAAGDYTANFTVSDGSLSKSYEVPFTVTASSGPQPVTFTGTITAPDPFAAGGGVCLMPLLDEAGTGVWGGVHDLPPEVEGTWDFGATPASVIVTFTNAAGDVGGTGNSGKVGEGMDQAMVCGSEPMTDYIVNLFPA